MSAARVVVLDTPEELARRAAVEFQSSTAAVIGNTGRFAVALSGGSTPKAMLMALATPEFAAPIDWARVHVFWSDERCVPPDRPESNYAMARGALLSRVAIPSENVHRMPGEVEPEAGAREYDETLRAFFGTFPPRFDLIYLGLGPDGHTASLFPNTEALDVTDAACAANRVVGNPVAPWRLTFTYPAINAARAVVFLVEGDAKASIVAEVLRGPCDLRRLPSQGVNPSNGTLTWLLDAAAAARL